MIRIGMILGDRYEILEKVGTGGMSDVYKAKCHKLNRFVAVKVLKQEFSENTNFVSKFRVEAQAAAGLMHPNIVSVYDVGEENGVYYIVMELVEGITLKNYIEKKARLSVKEAISIAIQVSMGIEAAHNNHIIHRDIKPQNIIISKEGKVKVTDFGIAKAATSNTITSNVMGSVHYTSPEQARGGFSDEKSDIYSLGCTMFEMLTGHVPFDGETTVAIAIKHIQEDMPSCREFVSEIPASVENIILKATQKSPDRRYQSMGELIVDLKKSLISPEEDFVKVIPVDLNAATRIITEADMEEIKERTGTIDLIEIPVIKKEKPLIITNLNQMDEEIQENLELEEEEEEVDPKVEKITTILTIVAAVIIAIFILALAAYAISNFGSDKSKNEETTEAAEDVEMLDVVGLDLEEAKKQLNAVGLGTSVSSAESDEVEENQIISQEFKKGEMVPKYTTVKLVVCSGTASIEVPDVMKKTVEDAKTALEEAGFKVKVENAFSDTVEKDAIISTNPVAGSKVAKDSTVTIMISDGPEVVSVTIPDLRGMTETAAKAKLESLKLKCGTVSETNSDTVTVGCVVSQSLNPGDSVEEGTSINITLSVGPKVIIYKYVGSLNAPSGYTGGNVTIYITASDGDTRTISTSSFPCAVNETNFKVASGNVKYVFSVTTLTGEVDADGNAVEETKEVTKEAGITFTQGVNMKGKIIKGIAGFYYVHVPNDFVYECKAKGIFRKNNIKPMVGDNVVIEILEEDNHKGNVVEILNRNNELIRPAVANIDAAMIIFAISKPLPNFNLLDRFLIMMDKQSIPCIICFNKSDIASKDDMEILSHIYAECGYQVIFTSAKTGEGIDQIKQVLKGKTTSVAGPSGVGKSSLVNCLQQNVAMETGEISVKNERGKHTTRHTELIAIDVDSYIMDTPGFSSFSVTDMEKEEVQDYYHEFSQFEQYCKFQGCSHIHEKECGVKQALISGEISKIRYDNYVMIYEECKNKRRY